MSGLNADDIAEIIDQDVDWLSESVSGGENVLIRMRLECRVSWC